MIKCEKCGKPLTKHRSNPQNNYYWGVVVELLSEHTGFTLEEMHELLKRKFLTEHRMLPLKQKNTWADVEYSKSTSELDTKAFEEYLSQIRIWASAELGLWLPEPNEPSGAQ